jgi:hypothetical protein
MTNGTQVRDDRRALAGRLRARRRGTVRAGPAAGQRARASLWRSKPEKKGPLFRSFSPRGESSATCGSMARRGEVVQRRFRDAGSVTKRGRQHRRPQPRGGDRDLGRWPGDDRPNLWTSRGTAIPSPCGAIHAASCSQLQPLGADRARSLRQSHPLCVLIVNVPNRNPP